MNIEEFANKLRAWKASTPKITVDAYHKFLNLHGPQEYEKINILSNRAYALYKNYETYLEDTDALKQIILMNDNWLDVMDYIIGVCASYGDVFVNGTKYDVPGIGEIKLVCIKLHDFLNYQDYWWLVQLLVWFNFSFLKSIINKLP